MIRSIDAPAALIVVLLGPLTAACPLPIARTETLSAAVTGLLVGSDGTPRPGVEIAVSTAWDDSLCAAGVVRATTDSAGRFRLPGTQKRYRVTWLVPLFDRASPGYNLCVSVADTMQIAYHGRGSLDDTAAQDLITCLEWAWAGRSRVTCSGDAEHAIAEGGRWTDADAGGWYRLILAYEPTVEPGRRPDTRPHAYVQWVEHSRSGPPYPIRATVELEIDRKVTGLWETAVFQRDGRWYAGLTGTRKTFLNDFHHAEFAYRLGRPGQASRAEAR